MITSIKIKKLWGINSFNIKLEDNKIIIVAENGEGKTVLLRLIFYFLSKQWDKLSEYDFQSITMTISGKEYTVDRLNMSHSITPNQIKIISDKYPIYKDFINKGLRILLKENKLTDLKNPFKIKKFAFEHSISESILENIIQDILELKYKQYNFDFDIPILFLPTYRRIEQDFGRIFQELKYKKDTEEENLTAIWDNISPERWETRNKSLELVEFGLKDIEFKLNKAIESNNIEIVKAFVNKCNSFFVNKLLFLDKAKVKVKLTKNNTIHELNQQDIFSSGEKQIISIFFYLFLNSEKYFLIFDEPELSISIRWQERLLNELSEVCLGYVVATHSHSIVTDEQEKYLFSVDELSVK